MPCCCRCKKGTHCRKPSVKVTIKKHNQSSIEARKIRLDVIFKIIYVVAAAFFLFVSLLAENTERKLEIGNILYASITAFTLVLGAYLISYVITELRCMKIFESKDIQELSNLAERQYSNIFIALAVSGIFSILIMIVTISASSYLTKALLVGILLGAVLLSSILSAVNNSIKNLGKSGRILAPALATIMSHCFFFLSIVK